VTHKNKINLEKVIAALNTVCPACGYSITPSEVLRVDFERMRCPKCGAVFVAKSESVRKAD
jgi:ribosomal protein S27AE